MVNVSSYCLEDLKLEFNGVKLQGPNVRIIICALTALLGLIMTTKGGYYVLDVIDILVFRILGSITNLLNIVIFIKLTDHYKMFEQLGEATKEGVDHFSIWILKNVSIYIFGIFLVSGIIYIEVYITPNRP